MRNVLVTGGSRGLGLGIAKHLSETGYRVIAVARKTGASWDAAFADAEAARPGSLHFVPFDLAEIEKIPDLVKAVKKAHGPIHGLVNNAALGTEGLLATMPHAQIESLIRLNTLSPIVLTKHVLRAMMAEGSGRIVNISSIIGFTGYSGLSAYGATKAAMIGFTRSLAREVGRLGITVNAVAPGFLETDMTGAMSAEERTRVARRSAMKRLPEIGDVAQAVAYLLGDGTKNITGTVMTVDAGNTA